MASWCNLYWGSHGCDLPPGHEGVHQCGEPDHEGICSQFEVTKEDPSDRINIEGRVRYRYVGVANGDEEWSKWLDSRAFRHGD